MYLQILIAGFGGGVVRGLVGFIKHQYSYKNIGFNLPYFLIMTFLSGIIGVLTAATAKGLGISEFSPALALVVGYAGGDFIENVYKIIVKKPSLFLPTEKSEKEN